MNEANKRAKKMAKQALDLGECQNKVSFHELWVRSERLLTAEREKVKKLLDALRDMWGQFSYKNAKFPKGHSGGLSALEHCEEVLSEFEGEHE